MGTRCMCQLLALLTLYHIFYCFHSAQIPILNINNWREALEVLGFEGSKPIFRFTIRFFYWFIEACFNSNSYSYMVVLRICACCALLRILLFCASLTVMKGGISSIEAQSVNCEGKIYANC